MRLIDADAIEYESIDSCDTERYERYYGTGIIAVRKEDIDEMPSAHPESHWIPCSERLPEKDGEYLTTWIDAQKKLCVNVFLIENGVWYWNQKYIFPNWRIIAWMPLPEPAKLEND